MEAADQESEDGMGAFDDFDEILTEDEPLGTLTSLSVGGPAKWMARSRTVEELSKLIVRCRSEEVPYRIFGGGSNILVGEAGFAGVVIQLTGEEFARIQVRDQQVTAGAGASLTDLIGVSCRESLSGLESLAGIPGTIGGALMGNTGGRTGDIGQHVHLVHVMDTAGNDSARMRADIRFGYRSSNLDDSIILGATFDLVPDSPDSIVRRIKKIWIAKKASQPFAFQRAGYAFRNPRGLSAVVLIENSGLGATKVGGAELCDRDPSFVIAHEGAPSRDVLRLIDLVRSKVEQRTGVVLDLQIDIWA